MLTSGYSHPYVIASCCQEGWCVWTLGLCGQDAVWYLRLDQKRHCVFHFAFLHLLLRRRAEGTNSYGGAQVWEPQLLPTAMSLRLFGTGASSSCQAFRWLQPHETPWAEPPKQATVEFLTHRNYEKITCFRLQSFGVICSTAIDNQYSIKVYSIS